MEKVTKHKKIVSDLITMIGSWMPKNEQVETQVIQDHESGYYVLFEVGWEDTKRIYLPFVHLDVKPDGKVWVQHDGTDLKLALLLHEEGIAKSDIVLGFQAPFRRKLIPDFAVE